MVSLWQQCCYVTLLSLLLLLAGQVITQVTSDMLATPTSGPGSSISPLPNDPDVGNLSPLTFTTSPSTVPMPTATDSVAASDNNNNNNNQTGHNSILNYYFLLLAVAVIIVGLLWYTLVRRSRRKMARAQHNAQSALGRDLDGMPGGRRWVTGRFMFPHLAQEEGLDERGQAPPPYVPTPPEAAVHPDSTHGEPEAGQAIPLRDLSGEGPKPPDYEEHLVPPRVIVGNAGPSTRLEPGPGANNWYRHWYRHKQWRAGIKPR